MEYKAKVIINATLMDMLNILDARTLVSVYKIEDGKEYLCKSQEYVWKLLNFYTERKAYANYKVIGINVCVGHTNILIEKEA